MCDLLMFTSYLEQKNIKYLIFNTCELEYKNYFENYGQALVNSRISSQFKGGPIDENIYDAVIGHGRRHLDLITEIKKRIE